MDEFKRTVREYYWSNKRDLPWREEPFDAYRIFVSEIMLQQTQANRVIPKYNSFLKKLPTATDLANASLADVLREWSGLGYNRRAKYLHQAAKQLSDKEPWTLDDLLACQGIGKNTAAAIIVYTYNQPMVFIETNIRTVFLRHFFEDQDDVPDSALLPLIAEAIDNEHPRDFYYGLMDYGSHLKKTVGNVSKNSKHYAKQSRFEGSTRQIRGEVLRQLALNRKTDEELARVIEDTRLPKVLVDLENEGLIAKQGSTYALAM